MRLPWAFLSRPKASGARAEGGQGRREKWIGTSTDLRAHYHVPDPTTDTKTGDPLPLFYRWENAGPAMKVSRNSIPCQQSTPAGSSQLAGQTTARGESQGLDCRVRCNVSVDSSPIQQMTTLPIGHILSPEACLQMPPHPNIYLGS